MYVGVMAYVGVMTTYVGVMTITWVMKKHSVRHHGNNSRIYEVFRCFMVKYGNSRYRHDNHEQCRKQILIIYVLLCLKVIQNEFEISPRKSVGGIRQSAMCGKSGKWVKMSISNQNGQLPV